MQLPKELLLLYMKNVDRCPIIDKFLALIIRDRINFKIYTSTFHIKIELFELESCFHLSFRESATFHERFG